MFIFRTDELGVSVRAYANIESGKTALTIRRLNQISQILKVPVKTILELSMPSESSNATDKALWLYIEHLEEEITFLRSQLNSAKID